MGDDNRRRTILRKCLKRAGYGVSPETKLRGAKLGSDGKPKKELTLCLTRTDVFEVKQRINELEDKDRSKMRAGYYFEEALSELEEQKFKEKKK